MHQAPALINEECMKKQIDAQNKTFMKLQLLEEVRKEI